MQRQLTDSCAWLLKFVATPLECLTTSVNLSARVNNLCNATLFDVNQASKYLFSPVTTCAWVEPNHLVFAKTCISNMVSCAVTTSNVNNSLIIPTVATTLSISTLSAIIFFTVKYIQRAVNPPETNHLMELVNAIQHGDDDAVSDCLRHYRDVLSTDDLQYALTIAEQTAQDDCYFVLSLALIDQLADNPAPRAAIVEDDNNLLANEKKLIDVGYQLTKIPPAFLDPVDQTIMDRPVTLSTQQNIDQRTLKRLKHFNLFKCPTTNLPINEREFDYPVNTGLKNIIDSYVEKKVKKYSK